MSGDVEELSRSTSRMSGDVFYGACLVGAMGVTLVIGVVFVIGLALGPMVFAFVAVVIFVFLIALAVAVPVLMLVFAQRRRDAAAAAGWEARQEVYRLANERANGARQR